ncbi:MAG: 4-phosphoerythronate dehydrogenase [Proteobacteria bacterium]|nr:4-phosphoerythronate dehydrogenase [Pseudomonadota bacterium]
MTFKLVADEKIALIDELFPQALVIKKPGELIEPADVVDADMLWVRTVTTVDAKLLSNSSVKFVGTATAGYDHLDVSWLGQNKIGWANAHGANAVAVAEYILCVIAAIKTKGLLSHAPIRAGIIGVGQVGSVVEQCLQKIGFDVVVNDPPRAAQEPEFISTPLEKMQNLDLLCLHPALTRSGAHPSYHLLDNNFLNEQNAGMVLINAARGAVVDTGILLKNPHIIYCLDVWEHEPDISLKLLQQATIATPHIAGYSESAKKNASLLLYQQAEQFFGWKQQPKSKMKLKNSLNLTDWERKAKMIFDPWQFTKIMQQNLLRDPQRSAQTFRNLRNEYVWRKSFL